MKETLAILMPVIVCVVTGFIGYLQYRFKYSYELRIKKDAEREQELTDIINVLQQDVNLLKDGHIAFKKLFNDLKQELYVNNEVTKRIEIGLMIIQHPKQTFAIQRLIEEYKGNHYIYDVVKTWAEENKVDLNPKLLERMEYQQSISINNKARGETDMA